MAEYVVRYTDYWTGGEGRKICHSQQEAADLAQKLNRGLVKAWTAVEPDTKPYQRGEFGFHQ